MELMQYFSINWGHFVVFKLGKINFIALKLTHVAGISNEKKEIWKIRKYEDAIWR